MVNKKQINSLFKLLILDVNILSSKELSHEIEMGCWWYGWKEPYLEMNL
jgi:hypothetical protein